MATASLTRRIAFTATHRYWRPDWSEAENRKAFGTYAAAHEHTYTCEVTVDGTIEPDTGMAVDLTRLDRALEIEVRQRFDGRAIHRDVPPFAGNALQPTCENLARFIFERMADTLGSSARLRRVVVAEDPTLWACFEGP